MNSEMRKLLLLVGAVVFVDSVFFAALTPLLPKLADELELSKAEAGALAGAYAFGALAGGIPGGLAAARLGVKPTVLIGLAGMTVTTLTFGFADTYWLLLIARVVQGLASAFSWTAGLAWLVAAAPRGRRGELIGAAMGSAIFGALFGPVIGAVAVQTSRALAFSAVAFFAVVLAIWTLRTPAFAPGERQPLRSLTRVFGDRPALTAAWLIALPGLIFGVISVLGPLRLDELGFGAVAIGATWLVAAGLEAVLSPIVGRISDRRGRIAPLVVGLTGAAVVATIIPWLQWGPLLAVFVVLNAITVGTLWAPSMSLLSDRADALGLDQAYAFALVSITWAAGATVGPAAGGALAQATRDAVPYTLLALACVLTLAALWRSARSS
jgi:MFS family permease